MGFSLKKALRKLDTGARRTLSGLDDLRRGDVKGAHQNLKQAGGIAHTFARSTFQQALRDGKHLARAHGDAGTARVLDTFLAAVKKSPTREPVKTPAPEAGGLDGRFTTLPVEPRQSEAEAAFTLSVTPTGNGE